MHHRGHRVFEQPLDSQRILSVIQAELAAMEANGIRVSAQAVTADDLVVSEFRSPDYRVTNLRLSIDGVPLASRLDYEGTACVKYPARYLAWWLVPTLMAAVYGYTTSPLVVLALPVGYALLRLSHRVFLPLWAEELAFRVEKAVKQGGA